MLRNIVGIVGKSDSDSKLLSQAQLISHLCKSRRWTYLVPRWGRSKGSWRTRRRTLGTSLGSSTSLSPWAWKPLLRTRRQLSLLRSWWWWSKLLQNNYWHLLPRSSPSSRGVTWVQQCWFAGGGLRYATLAIIHIALVNIIFILLTHPGLLHAYYAYSAYFEYYYILCIA